MLLLLTVAACAASAWCGTRSSGNGQVCAGALIAAVVASCASAGAVLAACVGGIADVTQARVLGQSKKHLALHRDAAAAALSAASVGAG